jgi:signal transduction histidine kinase
VQWQIPDAAATDVAAAFLQGAVTLSLALTCVWLWRVHRKRHYLVWSLAWLVYSLRIAVIVSFLATSQPVWLYWHQVATGWTALALLYGGLVFTRGTIWRPWYLAFAVFPVLWSYLAIYRLDSFFLAAWPAVLFLSAATALTAWAFERNSRLAGSPASRFLGLMFLLWALHHLDYPILRAQGVWSPWGYYLDIVILLGVGLGILMLVMEDLRRGLVTLSGFASGLQSEGGEDLPARLLDGLLTLPAVRGAALVLPDEGALRLWRAAGACAAWTSLDEATTRAALRAIRERRPALVDAAALRRHRYTAALPVLDGDEARGALVVVSDVRDPFAALDESFLVAVGHQVGAALAHDDLTRRLATRTEDLGRLAARMVRQHEDERRHLSRELHDETAQVLAAVIMQIGLASEAAGSAATPHLERARALIDDGIRGIRRVTADLRPSLLDDLGLAPALRGLVDHFRDTHEMTVDYAAPDTLPPLPKDAELAVFRSLQEALSNVARHAGARLVDVALSVDDGTIHLRVHDDGVGFANGTDGSGTGLVGMRERMSAVGGRVDIDSGPRKGTELVVRCPLPGRPA